MGVIWFNDGSNGILQHDLFPLTHYEYGEAYFGSYRGMRFRVAREPLENVHYTPVEKRSEATLQVTVWKGPYSYNATPKEERVVRDFAFTEEGLDEIGPYLNQYYQEHKSEMEDVHAG